MPSITDKTPLEAGCYFHIYNRGINKEKIFLCDEHYKLFMDRYNFLLEPYLETYAYCLLPNHFHFLIKLNDTILPGGEHIVSTHLNILFSQHARMINKESKRYGNLFCKSFKRIKIKSDFYLQNLVPYIHRNPLKHGLTIDYQSYPYGSYKEIVENTSNTICMSNLISLFGSMEEFIHHHEEKNPFAILGKLRIETHN